MGTSLSPVDHLLALSPYLALQGVWEIMERRAFWRNRLLLMNDLSVPVPIWISQPHDRGGDSGCDLCPALDD